MSPQLLSSISQQAAQIIRTQTTGHAAKSHMNSDLKADLIYTAWLSIKLHIDYKMLLLTLSH